MLKTTNSLSGRIFTIDALRGIAALAVCVFHITNGNAGYLSDSNVLKTLGGYGWLGVEVFFVISGFIIPYSMYRSKYTIRKVKPFLFKRISRIDPPYIFTILLVLGLNYLSTLSPYYAGEGFTVDAENLVFHIGYLNGVMNEPWLNPVFWTLAIEFQFYIVMALGFILLIHKYTRVRYAFILGLLGMSFILPSYTFFFKYSVLFIIGILAFYHHAKMSSLEEFVLSATAMLLICYLQLGMLPTLAALGTLLMIHVPIKLYFLEFLGMISYSLYLTHVPVGGRIINLSINFVEQELIRSFIAVGAVGFSVGFAYLFFRFIEAPSIQLSKSIKYDHATEMKGRPSPWALIASRVRVTNKR